MRGIFQLRMGGVKKCVEGACIFAALFFVHFAHAQSTTAGAIGGNFSVSPAGAATYSVPIKVPPGIAGMQPKLSLEYNSQSSNGMLGMGWNLSGLSSISRCPRTMAQDGVRGGVNYDWNDRFCMDGQRLVLVGGTYGAPGSEYRTELESFSKIVANGAAGNGPASFTVQTKAGLTMQYGATEDSRIEAQGKPTAAVWALNRIADVKGNAMTITYYEDGPNPAYYPSRIDYAGNSVVFEYEFRPDTSWSYQAGSASRTVLRLTRITSYSGSTMVEQTTTGYGVGTSGRSRVESLTKCAAGNSCLPTSKFQWVNDVAVGFAGALVTYPSGVAYGNPGAWPIVEGDFNGDGKGDFIMLGAQNAVVYLANNSSGFDVSVFNFPSDWNFGPDPSPAVWPLVIGDFNGDGKTDFARLGVSTTSVFLSNGDGTFQFTGEAYQGGYSFANPSQWPIVSGDFNGDGRADFIRLGMQNAVVFLSQGNGLFTSSVFAFPADWNFGPDNSVGHWPLAIGDFNGDGLTDFARLGISNVSVFLSQGNGNFTFAGMNYANFGSDPQAWPVVTGDFNGDGKADFIRLGMQSAVLYTSLGNGLFSESGFNYQNGWNFGPDNSAAHWPLVVGDFNADGKTDFARLGMSNYSVFTSRGDGTFDFSAFDYSNFGTDPSLWPVAVGDFNGDGRTDFIRMGMNDASKYTANRPTATGRDAIQSVDAAVLPDGTSIGPHFDIQYDLLSSPTGTQIYTKGVGSVPASYPQVDIQAPMMVVRSYSARDGVGGANTTNYSYTGLRSELGTGRGLLGFASQKATNASTLISSVTAFNQSWPYIGTLRYSETRKDAQLLKRSTNLYSVNSGTYANSQFVYTSSNLEESWDLATGQAFPSIQTNSSFSPYGDPVQINVTNSTGSYKYVTNQYLPENTSNGNWTLGRLSRSTVTSFVTIPSPQGSGAGTTGTGGGSSIPSQSTLSASSRFFLDLLLPD